VNKIGFWLAPVLVLTAACRQEPEEAAQLTFHEIMKDEIDKNADELWDISNAAIGERAGLDPAKMDDDRWADIAERADAVRAAALKIATMDPIVIAKPGVKISDEDIPGGHTAAQVQARFDRDPQTLRDMANALAVHMGDLADAARAHDAAKAGPLVDQLDGVCENCHLEYWYPDQKELVNQIRSEGGDVPPPEGE
jgi:hypothetical protein